MTSLSEIAKKRALPGLLVVDAAGRLVYASEEAGEFLKDAMRHTGRANGSRKSPTIPSEIVEFSQSVARESSGRQRLPVQPRRAMLCHSMTSDYLVMAVSLDRSGPSARRKLVFLIIQKIGRRKGFDAERLGQVYGLTKREQEVVSHLVQGNSNKEIAASLKIGEYTVKDHLKHIMAKCQADSRLSIISKALDI